MQGLPDILAGCKVFPCVPFGKLPATADGWKEATDDPAQIAEWQRINPDFNWAVACGPSGLFVFDIDPDGLDYWAKLLERDPVVKAAVDAAFQVRTPRGGLHVYFKGEGPSTASRIADGIDTRGGMLRDGKIVSGGYVLLPGSKTEKGGYSILPGGALNQLPGHMAKIVPERKKTDTLGLSKNPDHDQPRNVAWAIDLLKNYVAAGRVAVQGKGGDNLTFAVVASILDKAISPGTAFDLLWEHWNPHCSPPWDDWELEQKIRNAAEYGEDTGAGVKGFQSNADAFANFEGMDTGPIERRKKFQPMWLREARRDVKPAKWLIPKLLPAEGTGILYGLTGSYKTFVALDWALCLAFGVPGQWDAPPVKHTVLFLAGESSYALRQERVDSWCEKHGLNPDDANLVFVPGVPNYNDTEGWADIRDGLLELKVTPDLVVIDTLTRQMTGLDENSNNDGKTVLKFNEELAAHYGCMVLAVGHTGKDQSKGLRGAQVFIDNSDAVIYLKKQGKGIFLRAQKLKEVDIDGEAIFLAVEEVGKSIVLNRGEAPHENSGAKMTGSRYPWASTPEVVAVLHELCKATGETSDFMIYQTISSAHGIDSDLVRMQLSKNDDLTAFRPTKGKWAMPVQEYDL